VKEKINARCGFRAALLLKDFLPNPFREALPQGGSPPETHPTKSHCSRTVYVWGFKPQNVGNRKSLLPTSDFLFPTSEALSVPMNNHNGRINYSNT